MAMIRKCALLTFSLRREESPGQLQNWSSYQITSLRLYPHTKPKTNHFFHFLFHFHSIFLFVIRSFFSVLYLQYYYEGSFVFSLFGICLQVVPQKTSSEIVLEISCHELRRKVKCGQEIWVLYELPGAYPFTGHLFYHHRMWILPQKAPLLVTSTPKVTKGKIILDEKDQ